MIPRSFAMTPPTDAPALVADIGGTNTRVALADGPTLRAGSVQKYRNSEFSSLDGVLRVYLESMDVVRCSGACVALAGPVRHGIGHLTNLDWRMDEALLGEATGAPVVALLNDLQAQGYALGHMAPGTLRPIIERPAPAGGETCLMVGLGTGFNAASVLYAPGGRVVTPSEAGHANLPVRTEQELRLCRYVETAHGFPAVEDVLSGRGLERVYTFLSPSPEQPQRLSAAEVMAAAQSNDRQALDALELFIGLLGTVAGNLSLIHLPFGGVYLCGGVAQRIAPYLGRMGFAEAFANKGRFADFMRDFPVWLVKDDFAALTGCASYLHQRRG
jgi:glucokinase